LSKWWNSLTKWAD